MSHEYELDTDERMMREGERYEKEKMKEFLINEHGMDIVEESNCLPKQMMYKSMASKLAEYKVKFFIGMFDDEDWDYDRPDTLISYSYTALYYLKCQNKYMIMRKDKNLRLGDDCPVEYSKKIRNLGRFDFSFFDNRNSMGVTFYSEDMYHLIRKVFDEHECKLQIKKDKKAAKEALIKEKEKRKKMAAIKKITIKANKSVPTGKWSGIVL